MAKSHNGSQTINLTFPDNDINEYHVDYDTGQVFFVSSGGWYPESSYSTNMSYGLQYILAEYRGGYETIPDDLDLLCRELVADAFNMSKKDVNVSGESLGDYSYSLADRTQFNDNQMTRMNRWADIRVA